MQQNWSEIYRRVFFQSRICAYLEGSFAFLSNSMNLFHTSCLFETCNKCIHGLQTNKNTQKDLMNQLHYFITIFFLYFQTFLIFTGISINNVHMQIRWSGHQMTSSDL